MSYGGLSPAGNLFSGRLIEPTNIEEGMVNVKFNSNCIAILCPIKETPLKTWRLDHITSFGQCGGILTFECCCSCSDPNASRCSINIVQEKPATILNIMERAIRNNPNTSEIHYERSILGDIYHCSHECGLGRLLSAHSDPNIFRSCSASPLKGFTVPIDLHSSLNLAHAPSNTLESNDSGLPGTPQAEESLSLASSIPSPTGSNKSNPSFKQKERSPFRSPKHSSQQSSQLHYKGRSMSDSRPTPNARDALKSYASRQSDDPTLTPRYATPTVHRQVNEQSPQHHHPRLTYAMISHDASPKLVKKVDSKQSSSVDSSVTYATVKNGSSSENGDVTPQLRERKSTYNRLQPVNEDQEGAIYDVPNCDFSTPFSPQSSPAHRSRRISEPSRSPRRSVITPYRPGSDRRDRAEDYDEPPPVPKHRRPLKEVPPPVSQLHQKNGMQIDRQFPRRRLQSSSDVLESGRPMSSTPPRSRGSVDDLLQTSRNRSNSVTSVAFHHNRQLKGSSDLLAKLHEEEEKLTKVLAQSRRERNDELLEARDRLGELNRPFHFNIDDLDYDEPDPDMILETCSNLVDYRSHIYSAPSQVDKVLTKVANNSVRGYAYKITIPVANTQYDVPRRAAAAADLSYVRSDAPPKPIRCSSIENLHFVN